MHFGSGESSIDCKPEDNCRNFKCPHIEAYKQKNGLESYEIIHGFFISCLGKGSRIRKARDYVCKAESCRARFKRVHVCMYCAYFGCFSEKHIHQHADETQHFLAVDTSFGHVYCFKCQDYEYDTELEEIAYQYRLSASTQRSDHVYKHVTKSKDTACLEKIHPSKVALKDIGLRGIINMGNTCYINCILQSLIHAPVIRDYFLSDEHKCKFQREPSTSEGELLELDSNPVCFPCEMGKIVHEFYSGKVVPYVPARLLFLIWTHVKSLAGYVPHDAHEFLLEFLNVLHKHCKETNGEIEHHANCMMDKIFTGFSQSELTCLNCESVSTKITSFKDISLGLDSHSIALIPNAVNKKHGSPMPTLIDCLERLTQTEDLGENSQRTCDKCQSLQKCSMQMKLKKLPLIITFHVNRLSKVYNTQPIEFPEHLDLTPYMLHSEESTDKESVTQNGLNDKTSNNQFYLFAVVRHAGDSESGHFSSYIRVQENKWFLCDDEVIIPTEYEEIRKIPAYLLFYHKKILENDANNMMDDKLTL